MKKLLLVLMVASCASVALSSDGSLKAADTALISMQEPIGRKVIENESLQDFADIAMIRSKELAFALKNKSELVNALRERNDYRDELTHRESDQSITMKAQRVIGAVSLTLSTMQQLGSIVRELSIAGQYAATEVSIWTGRIWSSIKFKK